MQSMDWLTEVFEHGTRYEYGEFTAYSLGGTGMWRVLHHNKHVSHPVYGLVMDKTSAIEFAKELATTQTV